MNRHSYALITGASAGIGKSLAYEYARNGHNLILLARRKSSLESIAADIKQKVPLKIDIHILEIDLSLPNASQIIENYCANKNIIFNIFINNAGVGHYRNFAEHSFSEIEQMLQLNIQSLTYLSYFCINYWKTNSISGHLVNIASVAAYVPLDKFVVYAASKAYVKNFSQALRLEMSPINIRVSCVCPGGTKTDFFQVSGQNISSLGEKLMMTSEECAKIIYKGVARNRATIIPGFSNKLTVCLSKFLPECVFTKWSSFIYKLFMNYSQPAK